MRKIRFFLSLYLSNPLSFAFLLYFALCMSVCLSSLSSVCLLINVLVSNLLVPYFLPLCLALVSLFLLNIFLWGKKNLIFVSLALLTVSWLYLFFPYIFSLNIFWWGKKNLILVSKSFYILESFKLLVRRGRSRVADPDPGIWIRIRILKKRPDPV